MARNSLELRKRLTLSGFYRLSHQIATDYALTTASTARTVLMERYEITESTFYTLLEFAFTHHLVSDRLTKNIREKVLENQASHGNKGYSSRVKYNKLWEERIKYSAFSKKDIAYIATFYATYPNFTKQDTRNIFCFHSTTVLDQILKKACVELIISDKVFKELRSKAIENAEDVERTVLFFDNLAQSRAEAKKIKKDKISTC